MSYIEEGSQGAYRQSWRKGNPRSLLKTLIERNPKADRKKIYDLFWDEVEDDKQLLQDIVGYWLDHNYHSLLTASLEPRAPSGGADSSGGGPTSTAAKSEQATAAKGKLQDRIRYETRIVLLELVMPNDKRLADCTGAECSRFGGWLFQLSKKVPANKTVGATLSEDEVYRMWQYARTYNKPKK
jgi:hypothetical protein